MPHIRLRGLSTENVIQLNVPLVKELSQIIGTPEEHFTFEHVQTNFFEQGKVTKGYPYIEMLWFFRNQEIQDACAKIITSRVKGLIPDQDVAVVFTELSKTGYYENGKHF